MDRNTKAPDWFRSTQTAGGFGLPPPPKNLPRQPLPPEVVPPNRKPFGAEICGGSSSLKLAAAGSPQAASSGAALPSEAPPALASLPPPPPPMRNTGNPNALAVVGATSNELVAATSSSQAVALRPMEEDVAIAVPSPNARDRPLALALLEGDGDARADPGFDALAIKKARPAAVNAAPKRRGADSTAFMIPGLQRRPFTEDELEEAWDMINLDRHDFLEIQDLRRCLELCGEERATDAELEAMIRMLDRDGSGKVRQGDFWQAFTDPPPVFRNFDLHRRTSAEDDDEEEPEDFDGDGESSGSSSDSNRRRR